MQKTASDWQPSSHPWRQAKRHYLVLCITLWKTCKHIYKLINKYLQAGTTKTSFGPKTDQILEKLSVSSKRKAVECFQEVFRLSFEKLNGHLLSLPAYQYYKSVRIFDPRQLPALDHDIQVYSNILKQLANPSCELLEEWLFFLYKVPRRRCIITCCSPGILGQYGFKVPSPMTVWLQGSLSYDSMASRFPLL